MLFALPLFSRCAAAALLSAEGSVGGIERLILLSQSLEAERPIGEE